MGLIGASVRDNVPAARLAVAGAVVELAAGEYMERRLGLLGDVYQKGRDWFARVYEANVPRQVNHPDIAKHYTNIPMAIQDGNFTLARVKTSEQNYFTDMDVVGWLRPGKDKALPGVR